MTKQDNPDRFCLCGCDLTVAPQNRSGWLKIHRHRSPERKAIALKAKQKRKIKSSKRIKVSQIENTEWEEIDAVSLKVGQCFQYPVFSRARIFAVTDANTEIFCSEEHLDVETESQGFLFCETDRVLVPPQKPSPQ